jgi:hypothetical protein
LFLILVAAAFLAVVDCSLGEWFRFGLGSNCVIFCVLLVSIVDAKVAEDERG